MMADEVMRKEGEEDVEASKMQDTQHEEEGEEAGEKAISDRRLVIHKRGTEEESEGGRKRNLSSEGKIRRKACSRDGLRWLGTTLAIAS
jgi:hypothetical protein